MYTFVVTAAERRFDPPRRAHWFLVSSLVAITAWCLPVYADGPFVGIDLGVSRPTNANYHAHVHEGATANPFVGYMFNDYLGLQGQVHAILQEPDNDPELRRFAHQNQMTTLLGATVGPRLALPLDNNLELYGTFQAGGFTGLSGRLDHTAPGFSTGAGLNYYVTPQVAVGLFGRWNRVYMAPRPTTLVNLVPEQQGPTDAQFATGGISLTYRFHGPEAPPPPPPPVAKVEPPPAPPMKKTIVLRAVHFDFDKSNIRPDAVPILDEAAEMLSHEGTVAVIVAGHTDSVGTVEYNLGLSKRRANAVAKYLGDHGVKASRIKTEGFGKSKPVASNDTADGRAQNRRVELNIE